MPVLGVPRLAQRAPYRASPTPARNAKPAGSQRPSTTLLTGAAHGMGKKPQCSCLFGPQLIGGY
eukprot:scaffold68726_cov75-Phaeocystis_antarctica.AAC.2